MLYTSLVLVFIVSLLLLLNHWHQNKGIIYLVLIIISFGLGQTILLVLNTSRDPLVLATLIAHIDPLRALMGPFIIYYFKSMVKGEFVWDKTLFLLSIPFLLCVINLMPYFAIPFEDKVAYFRLARGNRPPLAHLFLPVYYQQSFTMFYNVGCIVYGLRYLSKAKAGNGTYLKKKISVLINRILVIVPINVIPNLLVLFLLSSKSEQLGKVDFTNPDVFGSQFLFFLTLLLPLSFFAIPSWLYNERDPLSFLENMALTWKRVVNDKAKFSEEDSFENSRDFERIISYIEMEKPYVKTTFSLHDVSQALNIPHNRVATCFNKQLKVSFPTYRNKLRIEHSTALLRSGTHLNTSIEGIAEMSGFKSKSIFYKTFKEAHGTTPIDWIKENLEI
ncbi:helix-turn-helix domain-containing protein [Aquirufa sp. A-Brett2-15D]